MLIRETFAAGVPKRYNVVGNYFRLKRLTSFTPESIDVFLFRDNRLLEIDLTKADAGDYAVVDSGFDRIEVVSTVAQDVTFQVARGRVGSDRVLGEVNTIDGEYFRTFNLKAFGGGCQSPAVAAQFAFVQLWNPTSDRRAVVKQFHASSDGAMFPATARSSAVALTTLDSNPEATFMGGGGSSMQIRRENNAVVPGARWDVFVVPAGGTYGPFMPQPVLVNPGSGFLIACHTANLQLTAAFKFYEEFI